MKKNSILGRIFCILLLALTLHANVNLELNTPVIYKGSVATFTITANGEEVEFPNITNIAGYPILNTRSSQNIKIINGSREKNISKSYSFKPDLNVTIPKFEVKIDSQIYTTKETKIGILDPVASKVGDAFIVEIKADKEKVYVGGNVRLYVSFKMRADASFDRFEYENPRLENFMIRPVGGIQKSKEGEYLVHTLTFLLFPQKAGSYSIDPISAYFGKFKAGNATNDPFFSTIFPADVEWQRVFSNSLNLDVVLPPYGVSNVGKFDINLQSDKNVTEVNEPINLTLTIRGIGNIDDISKFKLNIKDAVVYVNDPEITQGMFGDEFGGEFVQKFAVVSDKNFTIPKFEFSFLDIDTNELKTIKSDEISVEILNQKAPVAELPKVETTNESLIPTIVEKEVVVVKNSYLNLLIGFLLGLVSFYVFTVLKSKVTTKPKKEEDIITKIRKAKDDKALFYTLLPYAKKSEFIDEILSKLEENLYKKGSYKIDKKELLEELVSDG